MYTSLQKVKTARALQALNDCVWRGGTQNILLCLPVNQETQALEKLNQKLVFFLSIFYQKLNT